jgi:hypothetical protein
LKGDLKATAFILAKEPEISRYIDPKVQINAKEMSPEEVSRIYRQMVRQVR